MLKDTIQDKRSTLVQIINEVDNLTEEEKDFVLYWIRAKKNAQSAAAADLTIIPNNFSNEDVYNERNALRNQKAQ